MRIEVDQLKCDTSGVCVKECPEVFRFQEGSKKAAPMFEQIPREFQQKCRKVATMCPTKAITIIE